jgi:hypothetical protein
MDRYSIFEQSGDLRPPRKPWAFPANHGGNSPIAERDLGATLQLLAERARYLTGASGVSIGLRSGAAVVCQASTGVSARELGSQFPLDSGLVGESLRFHRISRCDDAQKDVRTNRENWRERGIRSAMVGPLVREGEAVGAFELLAERPCAFEERDVATLQRLSEMTLTALEHFDAASRPLAEASSSKGEETTATENESGVAVAAPQVVPVLRNNPPGPEPSSVCNIQTCQACGFPVSESRTLCLDCEEAQFSAQSLAPAVLGYLSAAAEPGWLQSHLYTMGTLFIAALTVALLVLKLR